MSSKSNSNLNSSDDDAETLYQINESRPSSRIGTFLSSRSEMSMQHEGIEHTIPSRKHLPRTHNDKSKGANSQRDIRNSEFEEILPIHENDRQNLSPSDVEGSSARYSLYPNVVVKNPTMRHTKDKPFDKNNSHKLPLESDHQEIIKQLTARVDELTKELHSQRNHREIKSHPRYMTDRQYIGDSEDDCEENRRPLERTKRITNLTQTFSTGHNRQAHGLSDQPIHELSQVAPRSEIVTNHPARVSSGGDKVNGSWEKGGWATILKRKFSFRNSGGQSMPQLFHSKPV